MHFPLRILVTIFLHVWPARRPAGAQQRDGTRRNSPVGALPFFDLTHRQAIVRVFGRFVAYIQQHRGAKKLAWRNLIYSGLTRREMYGRVEMRAVMLQHPKTSGEVSVFLDSGIDFSFEIFFVAGPRHEFVVDGVAEIDHAGFSARYALPHRVLGCNFGRNGHERSDANE